MKILTYLFSFFVFAFSTISIPDVVARYKQYKTVTNENIIYS